jgi:hypothetical protein
MDSKSISLCELSKTQINELKQIRADLETLKNELITAQTKYNQRLSDYELKLQQLHIQAEKIDQEQTEKETNLLNATSEWRDMKIKLETSAMSPKQKVKLNVGGIYFETTIETLTKYSEGRISYFKSLFSRQWQLEKDPKDDSIFIDRDGDLFGYILQYLRTGKLAVDSLCDLLRRDLINEVQFYNLDNLVDLLQIGPSTKGNYVKLDQQLASKKLYSDTKILSVTDQIKLNKLSEWNDQQWQLIYSASRDGYTAKAFHESCDSRWPTVTVIRSKNGYIFGGFTTVAWDSTDADKTDTLAFLFTLKNPYGIEPTKYPIRERLVQFAVGHNSKEGPTFGSVQHGGVDLFLQSPFNGQGSRTFFPQSYQDTTRTGRITFTGDPYFSCDDVEVFTLM